jgi:hypothetical protein
MGLKNAFMAVVCAMLLGWNGASAADERRADEFLSLDLSTAVLSPKPLGPVSHFAPVQPDAGAQARARPATVVAPARVAHFRGEKPRGYARTKLARRHGNPLDAQAFDTRIQVWPCKSGGICNWQRPAPAR